MKEIKEELNKWRDHPCSCTGRFSIIKMSVLSNSIYRFNPNQSPSKLFCGYLQTDSKAFMRGKTPRIASTVLKVKKKFIGLTLPDFKTYYKAIVINRGLGE